MSKIKKSLLAFGTVAVTAAPIASVVACGSEASKSEVKLVTDSGSISDKSFNQQGFEALKGTFSILKQGTPTNSDVSVPEGNSAAQIVKSYLAVQGTNTKVVLAPGFYHTKAIDLWNSTYGLDKLKFIIADGQFEDGKIPTNVAQITYETKTSGFEAGVLAGLYLEAIKDVTPTVGMWGGGPFPGVTDFMVGFYEGIQYFNTTVKTTGSDVKFAKFGTPEAYTNSTFEAGKGVVKAEALKAKHADILLPVAGPQVADALSVVGTTQIKVIGVDTDQKIAYPGDKAHILTSILKNLKDSMVDVWKKSNDPTATVADGIKGFGEHTIGTLANGLTGIEQDETTGTIHGLYSKATTPEVIAAANAIKAKTWDQTLASIVAEQGAYTS